MGPSDTIGGPPGTWTPSSPPGGFSRVPPVPILDQGGTRPDAHPDQERSVLTADDVLTARFSSTQLRVGYRQDDVDRFLDRVARTLRARSTGVWPADPVTAEEVARAVFRPATFMSGYEPAEVDAFLAEVATTLSTVAPAPPLDRRDVGASRPGRRDGRRAGSALVELVVGERPDQPPAKVRRVPRAAARNVHVDAVGVHWRTWRGASGTVPAGSIAGVELLAVVFHGRGGDVLTRYALVLDRSGAALLRVGRGFRGRQWRTTADFQRWLAQVWTPLDVPVSRWTTRWGRAKDARRRWPEAFSFGLAYPYWTTIAVVGAYCAIVGVLDPLLGGR